MGILAMILVFIVLTLVAVCAHDTWDFYNGVRQQGVDRSKLIADTVLVCGISSVCNQSAIPFPVLPETKQQISSCTPCKCDVDCWSRGDCCVDLPYLYLTSSCQNIQLILNGSNANISSKFNFKMIASCPENSLYLEMKEQCDGFRNKVFSLDNDIQAPVTSVITHVTYRNKYCARCHGDRDVIRWDRFAECDTTFDINTISTINEFKNALSYYDCFLVHVIPSSLSHIPNSSCVPKKRVVVISTCNETGLWMDYDPSIEWACKNFQPGDSFLDYFKNIFCYICNPIITTVHHDVIIDRCNLTGKWQLYDKGLEDGCFNLPSIRRLRPFKNVYCMLCNGINSLSDSFFGALGRFFKIHILCSYCHDFTYNFQPMDIKITCPIQFKQAKYMSFSWLLRPALERECKVRVDSGDEGYRNETLMISKCNTTGEWHDYDESVQNMCELEEQFSINGLSPIAYQNQIYKNIFCFMCNPKLSIESVTGYCNVTGNWNDSVLEQRCQDAPEHIVWSPYKNVFCRTCKESYFDLAGPLIEPTYRSLFSFKLPSSIDLTKEEVTCSNGMYDSYKMACTNVYCPVGRKLKNESCIVLLEETKNLSYSIKFQLVSLSNHATYDGRLKLLLQNISSTIMDMMWRLESNLEIEYKTWSYQPCEERQMAKNTTISIKIPSIFFQAKIRIKFTRNRTALELALLDLRKTTFQLEYNRANFMFKGIESSMIVLDDSDSSTLCRHDYTTWDNNDFKYSNLSKSEENEYTFEYRDVSDLLACVMVQVSKNTYVYNNETETIILINTGTTLQRQDFEFQKDESIRVCRDHLNQELRIHPINTFNKMASIHSIFSFVCSVISIICLVITFVTYCLFKTLRSLPGKNNMCLVLCLLFAQILLQFGLWQSHHPIMCQVLAIGIHFFWMATFTSMNVCCFHMYRVFSSYAVAIPDDGDSRKVLMSYTAYICAVPFSLILAAATINYTLSHGDNAGYGGERCFLNNQYSIIFAFIVPTVAIFISNAVFLAMAFQKIRSSPIIECNSGDKRNFFMYVKLSTIAGIAWPLQVIDGLLELSVFSFFVTFVNALQGMFIFASYICNRRVWKRYMECCCRRKKPK